MPNVERLRAAIERLAAIDRSSCSAGERQAADWIAAALRDAGAQAEIELEPIHGTYWWPLGISAAAGIVAQRLSRRGARLLGGLLASAACAAVFDEVGAGRRWLRAILPKRPTANVVARMGDAEAARTLVIVAHHDAAHTSVFFDPRIAAFLGGHSRPGHEAAPRTPPVMAPVPLAPAMIALGALLGLPRLARFGALVCWGIIASYAEIAVRATVPGANDNLSGVATLLGVADALDERPVSGLRVLLVSTGAEESLMEGMRAFARRHFPHLPRERTRILCVDIVGSPHLVLAEAEGMLRLRRYDEAFNALIGECAEEQGIELRRGLEMRFGTDGLLGLRHGYSAAMLTSVNEHGAPSNYHWPTDTADRVDYDRLADAVTLCEAVIGRLASDEQTAT